MTTLDIERLVIDAPHLGEADGRRLAERIADGLRGEVPRGDSDIDRLARLVVADLLRQIHRV